VVKPLSFIDDLRGLLGPNCMRARLAFLGTGLCEVMDVLIEVQQGDQFLLSLEKYHE
jgi:hypothetical protein